jgi:hypothetical protein
MATLERIYQDLASIAASKTGERPTCPTHRPALRRVRIVRFEDAVTAKHILEIAQSKNLQYVQALLARKNFFGLCLSAGMKREFSVVSKRSAQGYWKTDAGSQH